MKYYSIGLNSIESLKLYEIDDEEIMIRPSIVRL
jgi:hypothetical protein